MGGGEEGGEEGEGEELGLPGKCLSNLKHHVVWKDIPKERNLMAKMFTQRSL